MTIAPLDRTDPLAITAFILANTRLHSPPLVPEITLHLAEESVPIWQKTEEELGEMNLPPPFWAFAWAGGQAMARYLLDHPELSAGRRVIDLGSGSALGAIAAMMSGSSGALAADIDVFAAAAAKLNAAANGVILSTTTADLLGPGPEPASLIVVGDLFYEKPLAERVMAWLYAARAQGTEVLVGDPRRSYFPCEAFIKLAEYRVPVTRELEDAEIKLSAVWALRHQHLP
jgi:predicted nicotinamide N-methyase